MDEIWEGVGEIVVIGLIIWGGVYLYQNYINSPSSELSGIIKYDDCRQIIKLKEGDSETRNKKFTCNYNKTQSGAIMSGSCVYTETENGICTKAYTYEKEQAGCKNNFKDGIFYPYLGYNDNCYIEPQYGQSPIDSLSLPLPSAILETAISDSLPTEIGQCSKTTVSEVGNRLGDVPSSGSLIVYANKGIQVSYETIQGIRDSLVGDNVYLCLIYIPTDCPAGDDRGKVYSAINLRTGNYWQAQDSSHSCGGA